MARGISVPFVADVAGWLRGTRRISDDLDDLADDLTDLSRDGTRSTDDLDDAFTRFARSADASMDRVARSTDRAMDSVRRDSSRAMDDLRDESSESAAEVAASFDGSVESIVEGFQEVAAQSSRIFGGIVGTVAGLAGGAAIGLVLTALDSWRQRQQEVADAAAGYVQMLAEANGLLVANVREQLVAQAAQDLTAEQMRDVVALANDLGVPWRQLVADAVTTNATLDTQLSLTEQIRDRQTRRVGLTLEQGAREGDVIAALQAQRDLYGRVNDALGVATAGWQASRDAAAELRRNAELTVSPIDSASARARTLADNTERAATAAERTRAAVDAIPRAVEITVTNKLRTVPIP